MPRKRVEEMDTNDVVATESEPVTNGEDTPKRNRRSCSLLGRRRDNGLWEVLATEQTVGYCRHSVRNWREMFARNYDALQITRTKVVETHSL